MSKKHWMLPILLAAGATLLPAQVPTPNVTSIAACPNGPLPASPQIPAITAGTATGFELCIYGNFDIRLLSGISWLDTASQVTQSLRSEGDTITPTYLQVYVDPTLFASVVNSGQPDPVVITVAEGFNVPLTSSGSFQVNPPITLGGPVYSGAVGSPANLTLYSGGTAPYTNTYQSKVVPPGFPAFPASATVWSGTPTQVGTFDFTFAVTDVWGNELSEQATLNVSPALSITNLSPLPVGEVGVPYSDTFVATGGTGGSAFLLYQSTLPPGLTLSYGGLLSGIPTAFGSYSFTVQVVDSSEDIVSGVYTLVILPPPLITNASPLPAGQVGVSYSDTFTATGGSGGYTFSILRINSLPFGLTLTPAGLLSGTPTTFGTSVFTVQVADSAGITSVRTFTLVIIPPTLVLTTPALGSANVGTALNIQFTATGGVPPYTFAESGALPPGTRFSAAGALTGTPTTVGTYQFVVTVTDSASAYASRTYSILILYPPLAITTYPALPSGASGSPYSTAIAATGGAGTYAFSVTRGAVPPGLTLSLLGSLSGTPTTSGTFGFTVQVTDAAADTASRDFTLVIAPPKLALTTGPLGNATLGVALNIQFAATGGVPPYTFAESGTLPPGTQFSTSGALSGTPTTSGTYQFQVSVYDTASASASQTYTLTVVQPPLTITTASPLPTGQKSSAYSTTFAATGGRPPYSWSATGLPTGLTLASTTGVLSGTPTQEGLFQIAVTVTDSTVVAAVSASGTFSLTISAIPITFTNAPLPNGTVAAAYTALVTTTGGDAPVTFNSTGLPAGLTLSPAGSITGTPTTAGSFTVVITATDVNGLTAKATYTVTIAPQLVISTTSAGTATLGSSFSATLAATGGTPPYTWSGSNLPAGFSLAANGTLSGTPTVAGAVSFSATVIDSNKVSTTKTISVTVGLPAVPGLTLAGIGSTVPPATQPSLTVTLGAAYPADITVKLTMTVVTDSGLTDPAFQFATGGLTAQTVIPAGSTSAPTAVPVQLGTDAATVTITAQLLAAGQDVTPSPAPKTTFRLNATAPVITSITATRGSTGFTVTVIGYSPSRDVSSASFTFSAASGSSLGTTQLTVPVSAIFAPWYSSAASAPFGSQFTFTQPFTVTGSGTAIVSVTVTLTNSVGTSPAASATLQ
jgi:hypothetical protein